MGYGTLVSLVFHNLPSLYPSSFCRNDFLYLYNYSYIYHIMREREREREGGREGRERERESRNGMICVVSQMTRDDTSEIFMQIVA